MLGYPYQNTVVLIGSKSGTTRTSAALTTAFAGNVASLPTGGASKVNLNILYTTGAGETNNSIEVRVESSPDRTNWYQIPNEAVSLGVSTLTLREFTFVGAAAATAYSISLPLDVQDEFYRFAFKESGVVTNAGTVYVEATLSGAK